MTNPNGSQFRTRRFRFMVLGLCACIAAPVFAQSNSIDGMNDAKKAIPVKRDPFWPVGYLPASLDKEGAKKKQEVIKERVNKNWNEAMKKVVINGVSSRSDDEFFAVINGEVKGPGDTVVLNHQGTVYTWSVESITPPGSVKLRRVSAL